MRRRGQRMKASDVFRESNPVFSKNVSFEVVFPEIEDIVIEVTESGKGVHHLDHSDRKLTYRKPNLPGEYVDCSNSFCYDGGISIGSIIRDMVRERVTERETSKICRGYEGSPKGRRRYRSCLNSFKVIITITYGDQSLDPA